MQKAVIREELITIPTYKRASPEKCPIFMEKRAYQGSTGKVYPLPVTEKIYDEKEDREYKAVILENDYLYVCVLPELGGRIQRALDKTNGYDFVYYNHVIKPALVGLAGPWISGGIEFNWPQHHRPSTFSPVNHRIAENPDGSVTCYVGETDVMYGTSNTLAITLYPDKAYIELSGTFYNPTDMPQTFLWWANPAVSVNDNTYSVFPPDVNAVMDHGKRAVSTFPIATGEYYKVDYSAGVDISRYKNIPVPTSYMAAHSDFDFIGNFDEGVDAGLLHVADHHVSPGKKQWTWGNGDFGRMWDKNLTDADGPYIELMTGVYTDNQPDFTWLKPNEEKTFTQYFMPYKHVGRVSNATRDIAIGVKPDEINVYSAGVFKNAEIKIVCDKKTVYDKTVDLFPCTCFTDCIPEFHDYTVTVCDEKGNLLCKYKEFVPKDTPVPSPMDPLKKPEEIESTEELFLAGQHLEQYRHATREPENYYLEGLKRDKTDIRLNNAYGLLLMRRGEDREALKYFEEAIKKQTWRNPNPYNGECYFNAGLAYFNLGEFDKAYDAFYKATWSMETAGNAFYYLAMILNQKGEMREAFTFAEKALCHNFCNMNARVLKLELLIALNEPYNDFLNESLKQDKLSLGILYRALPEKEFYRVMGDRTDNYLNLARLYERMGFFCNALDILKNCPKANPLVAYRKAHIYMITGNIDECVSEIKFAESLPADYCFPNNTADINVLKEAQIVMDFAGDKAPMAAYYLGNLYYDKKRYEEAKTEWEKSASVKTDFAMPFRNLSIYWYNKGGNPEKALSYITTAVNLEPQNSRFVLEQDQLLENVGADPVVRISMLEDHKEIIEERDMLCIAYVKLLNLNGRYAEALEILMHHRFHVWEGGEGHVAAEYKNALFALADKAMNEGDFSHAFELAESTLSFPENLGEGKLFNVPDNRAYLTMALSLKNMGKNAEAKEYFKKAAEGSVTPEIVRYYNDQSSEYIFYLGIARSYLGDRDGALTAMRNLIDFGNAHLNDEPEYDFFAVSMPELSVYRPNLKRNNEIYLKKLINLGVKGLGAVTEITGKVR